MTTLAALAAWYIAVQGEIIPFTQILPLALVGGGDRSKEVRMRHVHDQNNPIRLTGVLD